ncbi:MAG TPA: serine hydrolase domain-containing protein [Pyrinomonadaceae bacterium]|nr:serine hydrolase domain-containing protein [Pyrinomonadaceae bacterium]
MKKLALGVPAWLVICSLAVVAQKHSVSNYGMDARRLAEIPLRMNSSVRQGDFAGAVMLVARRGRVVSLEAVGYQDLESKRPMRTDTIFDIRSVTKPVTAIGIMILFEEGKLALNDPLEKYLPEFAAARKARGTTTPVTIRHLLTHTSGLPFNRPQEIADITVRRDRTLSEVVALLSKQDYEFEPGTQFRYHTGGYAILGRIIEVVSGRPYERFIKERIFDPLGMKDSFFLIPAEKQSRVASLYRWQDGTLKRWTEIEAYSRTAKYPAPEFGMYSTASDLAALGQMMLDGGTFKGKRILSKMAVEAMTKNHTPNLKNAFTQRPAYQGLGWGLSGDPSNDFPLTTPGSYGHNGAFGALLWIDPQEKLIRIFLEHRFGFNNESNIFMAMAGAAVIN